MKTLLGRLLGLFLPRKKSGGQPRPVESSRRNRGHEKPVDIDILEPRVLFSGAPVESSAQTEEEIPAETAADSAAGQGGNPITPSSIGDATGSDRFRHFDRGGSMVQSASKGTGSPLTSTGWVNRWRQTVS